MPMRVYFVVHAATTATPTEQQWRDLFASTKQKPFASAIVAAARAAQNYISANKRNQGTEALRYTVAGFELSPDRKAALLAELDVQAANHSITGNKQIKFVGVLQAELQETATDLGYGGQATNITVTIINSAFDPETAMQQVQAYLAANDALWHVPR